MYLVKNFEVLGRLMGIGWQKRWAPLRAMGSSFLPNHNAYDEGVHVLEDHEAANARGVARHAILRPKHADVVRPKLALLEVGAFPALLVLPNLLSHATPLPPHYTLPGVAGLFSGRLPFSSPGVGSVSGHTPRDDSNTTTLDSSLLATPQ